MRRTVPISIALPPIARAQHHPQPHYETAEWGA